jgi:hypothetical protein
LNLKCTSGFFRETDPAEYLCLWRVFEGIDSNVTEAAKSNFAGQVSTLQVQGRQLKFKGGVEVGSPRSRCG